MIKKNYTIVYIAWITGRKAHLASVHPNVLLAETQENTIVVYDVFKGYNTLGVGIFEFILVYIAKFLSSISESLPSNVVRSF